MSDHNDLTLMLRAAAPAYARVALTNIERDYPHLHQMMVTGPGEYRNFGEPLERHPAFFGSLDWHSSVEMHWVLVRLLRLVPGAVDGPEIRSALDRHLSEAALQVERAFCVAHPGFERPYGWAWLLTLAADLETWDDPDARRWAAAVRPLAELFAGRLVAWLPSLTYPVRHGVHGNTAFAIGRSLAFATHRAGGGGAAADLRPVLGAAARRLFLDDAGYDATWEPSGSDFLSPALVQAELIGQLLPADDFAGWLTRFLPGLASRQPGSLFRPVTVTDPGDPQGSHLHGLNLSRAWCWRRIADALPTGDPRVPIARDAAVRQAGAALGEVAGSHYMVEHWLAAFALLYLGDRTVLG